MPDWILWLWQRFFRHHLFMINIRGCPVHSHMIVDVGTVGWCSELGSDYLYEYEWLFR